MEQYKAGIVGILAAVLFVTVHAVLPSRTYAEVGGLIDLSYRNYETKAETATTENTTLAQRYKMNYRGYLYDRRVATLDAGITYDLEDNEYANQKTSTKNLGFNFTSLFFPRSPIPVTVYANRYTTDSQSRPNPGYKSTSTVYGFYWALPFKGAIPEVNISYNEGRIEDDNPTNAQEQITRTANLVLTKRKKKNYWWLSYKYGTEENRRRNIDTARQNLDFKSWWMISPTSRVDLTANFQDSEDEKAYRTRIHYDLAYSQATSLRVDYEFYRMDTGDSASNQQSFSTSLYHRPKSKIMSTTSYSLSHMDSDSSTMTSHYISQSISAQPLSSLSLNGDVSFQKQSGDDDDTTNQRYSVGGVYYKYLRRFQLSTGVNLAYYVNESGDSSDKTFTRTEYVGLSSRNIRYMSAIVSLSNYSTRSSSSSDRDEYRLAAALSSNYFRRLNMFLNYDYSIVEESSPNAPSSQIDFSTFDARATYTLGYGMLAGAGYNLRKTSDSDDEQRIYYQWDWAFSMFRRILVTMGARHERKMAGNQNDYTTLTYSSTLQYRIGRITLQFEYRYLKEDRKENDSEEQTYFVRATRTF